MEQSSQDNETMNKLVSQERKICAPLIVKRIQQFLDTYKGELEESSHLRDLAYKKIIQCVGTTFDRFKSRNQLNCAENQPDNDEQNQFPDMSTFDLKEPSIEEPSIEEPIANHTEPNHANDMTPSIEKRFKCDRCEMKFDAKDRMNRHRNHVHYKDFPYCCSKCRMGYFNEEEAKKHEASCRKIKLQCEECDYFAVDSNRLEAHKRVHTGEKPLKCPHEDCNEQFRWNNLLKNHIKTQHK